MKRQPLKTLQLLIFAKQYDFAMPFFRNFTYWIDKRKWKYVFLVASLELSSCTYVSRNTK